MLQETFGGALIHDPSTGFTQFSDARKTLAAAIGGGFVGLFSLFNIGDRFKFRFDRPQNDLFCLLRARRDLLRRRIHSSPPHFASSPRCYGGGFAAIPAYLADIFGTRYVGAIHGRLLTAWSTAGIVGPAIVNYLHDTRVAQGVPRDHVYDEIFYFLACLLVAGFVCNALIRPVRAKWHMKEEREKIPCRGLALGSKGVYGIGRGGLDAQAFLAWTLVGIPLAWGVKTLKNAAKIFQ